VDPLFTTPVNERLLEHWERINYARKHFTKNETTVYGTDDRGLIYVKYGNPDAILKKTVIYHKTRNPVSGIAMSIRPHMALIVKLELWTYHFNNRKQPSYYLFGRDNNSGRFELQKSLFNIISSHDYQSPFHGINGETGKLIVVYGILDELKDDSNYFADLYNDITDAFNQYNSTANRDYTVFEKPAILHQFVGQQNSLIARRDAKSPVSTTGVINDGNKLKVDFKAYRLLNKKGKTDYVVALRPSNINDIMKKEENGLNKYYVDGALVSFNKYGHRQKYLKGPYDIAIYKQGKPLYFEFSKDSLGSTIAFGMDIFKKNKNGIKDTIKTKMDPNLEKSSGPTLIPMPKPLHMNKHKVLISDVIFGHMQQTSDNQRIPFYPAINRDFADGDQMMVYFEVYNLKSQKYTVGISFDKYGGTPGNSKPKPYHNKAEITLNYTSLGKRDREYYSMKMDHFKPGWYDMIMVFRDENNKVVGTRQTAFHIHKKDN
jgi:GWxTD domain-containing protein